MIIARHLAQAGADKVEKNTEYFSVLDRFQKALFHPFCIIINIKKEVAVDLVLEIEQMKKMVIDMF